MFGNTSMAGDSGSGVYIGNSTCWNISNTILPYYFLSSFILGDHTNTRGPWRLFWDSTCRNFFNNTLHDLSVNTLIFQDHAHVLRWGDHIRILFIETVQVIYYKLLSFRGHVHTQRGVIMGLYSRPFQRYGDIFAHKTA